MMGKLLAAITAATLLAGCTPTSTTTGSSTTGTAETTQAGPTDAEIATAVRNDLNALHADWLPRVADVSYQPRTLRVVLQVDRATERELAQQIADAIRTNVGLGNNKRLIDWIHVVDGAGSHITQLGV
jgi:allophanate hydrolase subunit 1